MDVILLEKVQNLGKLGDRVHVRPGYARNYLIPEKKAVPATEENVKRLDERRAELEAAEQAALAKAQSRAETLKDRSITVSAQAGDEGKLFGSVGTADIAAALTSDGYPVEKREVRLPSGPIRVIGEHTVEVHLHADVNVAVIVQVVAANESKT